MHWRPQARTQPERGSGNTQGRPPRCLQAEKPKLKKLKQEAKELAASIERLKVPSLLTDGFYYL